MSNIRKKNTNIINFKEYNIPSKAFIGTDGLTARMGNSHLPGVPSADEVEKEGADLGEMNRLLMEKVEELTLYIIDLQKQIDALKSKTVK